MKFHKITFLYLSVTAILFFLPNKVSAQWEVQDADFPVNFLLGGINIIDQNVVWAAGSDSTFLVSNSRFTRTTNGGQTWTSGTVNSPFANGMVILSLYALDSNTAWVTMGYISASGGKVFKTTDGGNSWIWQTSAVYAAESLNRPWKIHMYNLHEGVVIGDKRNGYLEIYTTLNGGTDWVRVPQANIPAITDNGEGPVYFEIRGNSIWFSSSYGRLFRSTDRGYSWQVSDPNFPFDFHVAFRDELNGLAIYPYEPTLKETSDGGITWNQVNYTGQFQRGKIVYVPGTQNTYFSIGEWDYSGIYGSSFSTDGGHTWYLIDNLNPYNDITFKNAQLGWAGGYTQPNLTGGVYKFTGSLLASENHHSEKSIQLLPNPSSRNDQVKLILPEAKNYQIIVTDLSGKEVYTKKVVAQAPNTVLEFNLKSCPSGIYLVKIQDGQQHIVKKLVLL